MDILIIWAIGGVIVGFLLEYLIDIFWWRRKLDRADTRNDQSESLLREQVGEVEYLRHQLAKFNSSFDEYEKYIKRLEYELEGVQLEVVELRVQSEASGERARQFQSDSVLLRRQLQQRRGTDGPEVSRQLVRYKRALHEKVKENKALAMSLSEAETMLAKTDSEQDKVIATKLGDGEVYKPVESGGIVGGQDALEKINGIGHVYADRLRAAGIRTFIDLARMRAERLTDIIQPQKWQRIEPDRWISEAANLADAARNHGAVQ